MRTRRTASAAFVGEPFHRAVLHVRCKTSLRHYSVIVKPAVRANLVRAIVFVVRGAIDTSQVRSDLSSDTDAVANFDCLDTFTNLNGLAYNFMSNANR